MTELRIITEPRVRILARQIFDERAAREYLDENFPGRALRFGFSDDADTAAQALVEFAGRVCYQSWEKPRPGGNKAYIEHILEVGHGSVTEHAAWTFLITGVSRSLTHELIRHRVGVAISELSQRFVDMAGVAFVVPPALLEQEANGLSMSAWRRACDTALQCYDQIYFSTVATGELPGTTAEMTSTTKRKAARQAARSVLPECAETVLVWTANVRTIRHTIEQRTATGADAEIRRLFLAVLSVMKREAPHLFGDYDEAGYTEWRKV